MTGAGDAPEKSRPCSTEEEEEEDEEDEEDGSPPRVPQHLWVLLGELWEQHQGEEEEDEEGDGMCLNLRHLEFRRNGRALFWCGLRLVSIKIP